MAPPTSRRSHRFLAGLGVGYLNTVLLVAVGLWLTPFLLERLGQEQYGLWLVGTQILMYLALLDLGVVALLPREVAYATGRAGDFCRAHDLPYLIRSTRRVVLWQTPFVAAAAAIAWLLIPESWAALRWPLAWVLGAFVGLFPLRVFQAVLQGLQDLSFIGMTLLATWLAGTAVTVGLIEYGWGLGSIAAGWSVTQGLTACTFWWRLTRRFSAVWPRRGMASSEHPARYSPRGLWVSVSQIAQVLLHGSDLLILGRALGPLVVVPYACTGKLVNLLSNQPSMLMQMAEPALSELRASATRPQVFVASSALSQIVMLASGGVACLVIVLNEGFVTWWVGSMQFGGTTLTLLMALCMLLRHLNVSASYTLFCFGYERWLAVVGLTDGLVTVSLSFLLVRAVGPYGAVLGSIVGAVVVSLPANLRALARESEVGMVEVLRPLGPWFWRFGVIGSAGLASAWFWHPAGFWELFATGAAITAAYAAVMIPLLRRSPLHAYITPLLQGRAGRLWRRLSLPEFRELAR